MSDSISIRIDGPLLTPEKFLVAVEEFFKLLMGVEQNVTGRSSPESWAVQAAAGSVIIGAKAQVNREDVIKLTANGIKSISSGMAITPPGFRREEVRAAMRLASVMDEDGKFVRSIQVQNGDGPIQIGPRTVQTANAILASEPQVAFGSIEGSIEAIHGKEGQPFTCTIYDPVHKRGIVCAFSNIEAEDHAFAAFRPKRRLLAYGLIHHAREGYPVRIDVDKIRVFPEEPDLPTVEEIQAFY